MNLPIWEVFLCLYVKQIITFGGKTNPIMKWLCALIFLLPIMGKAQYTLIDGVKYVSFKKQVPVNDNSLVGIDWEHERPVSEFNLKSKNPATYLFTLQNDSVAVLSQKVNGTWQQQDAFQFQPWRWQLSDDETVSQFRITDFDHDGDEDVLCWFKSNINGNKWMYIYLNDGNKLVKLYDNAEDTDYWFMPEFEGKKRIIKSQYYGSAHGHDFESFYKLKGLSAVPLSKHHEERSGKEIREEYYKGVNGKWKLVKTETEKVTGE